MAPEGNSPADDSRAVNLPVGAVAQVRPVGPRRSERVAEPPSHVPTMSVGTVDNAGLRVNGHPRLAELGGQSSAELPEGADSSKGEISVVDGRANVLTIQ